MLLKSISVGVVAVGLILFVATRPVPDTSKIDKAPVVFVEAGTNECVVAFRRGQQDNPVGVTCLAVEKEQEAGQVLEKFVPKGTTSTEIFEQFLVADPWQDEFIAKRNVSDG